MVKYGYTRKGGSPNLIRARIARNGLALDAGALLLRRVRLGCLFLCVWFAVTGLFGAPPSAEDFNRPPEFSAAQISPDGKTVAILHREKDGGVLILKNLEDGTQRRLESKTVNSSQGVTGFSWLNGRRVLVTTVPRYHVTSIGGGYRSPPTDIVLEMRIQGQVDDSGCRAVDIDGKNEVMFIGLSRQAAMGRTIYGDFVWDPSTIRMPRSGSDEIYIYGAAERWKNDPDVLRLNASTGKITIAEQAPGAMSWLFDAQSIPKLAVVQSAATIKLFHRPPTEKKWTELVDLQSAPDRLQLLGLDATGAMLYASRPAPNGTWALYGFDLKTHQWGDPQLINRRYDIAPADSPITFAEIELTAPVFSRKSGDLAGMRFVADEPGQVWFESHLLAAQRALDRVSPGKINTIVGMNDAEDRFVVLSWSSRDPGSYGIFDVATGILRPVAARMPWITPAEMGPTTAFKCRSKDGLELDAYLTLPPGRAAKNLPMVVYLREQPWQRTVPGFDGTTQFLATRGYAVLQVNYRGSLGYGIDFHEKGRGELGRGIQDDIDAAVRSAIDSGVVDAARMAVVGGGFGGSVSLNAMAGVEHHYRCGVAIRAVTDWSDILRHRNDVPYSFWVKGLGLFPNVKNPDELRAISPLYQTDRITAPALLIHPLDANTAPVGGAKAMAAALKKAGRTVETYFYERHFLDNGAVDQTEVYRQLETFLARYLQVASLPSSMPGEAMGAESEKSPIRTSSK